MPGSPQGSVAPAMPEYPPDALADLAVSILGALEGNNFDVATTLSAAPSSTRAVRATRGCSVVCQLPEAPLAVDTPFYFGKDAHGYILVSPRGENTTWPSTRCGRLRPIRLTRWLVRAPPGAVVRHTCDSPSCIRVSHLVPSSQAANMADSVRRGRRRARLRGRSAPAQALRSSGPAPTTPMAAEGENLAQRAREARFCLTGFASPSKLARRAARSHLLAASGGRSTVPIAQALDASAGPEQEVCSENQTRSHGRP